MLDAADDLARRDNQSIAKAWQRYRAMIYLAADSGMRLLNLEKHGAEKRAALLARLEEVLE